MFGFQVFEVDNGIDAWNTFQKEQIDVVLTDINMPGLDGKELSHRIRNQSPSTIIAVMTGGAYDVATDLIEDGTVNYFFPKPLKLIELCKSLMAEVQPA
jgi:DNA-binding response OmpR family regulator